jgi:hypothetical protein
MLIQDQIINEINHVPPDKLTELYDLIHYFRLGLLHERQQKAKGNQYPLRDKAVQYQEPFEPVALCDWDALK